MALPSLCLLQIRGKVKSEIVTIQGYPGLKSSSTSQSRIRVLFAAVFFSPSGVRLFV